jgi:hypothetical protein
MSISFNPGARFRRMNRKGDSLMPFHARRTWVVNPIESAEALAEKLIDHSWCSCQGWSLGGYLFLNDQTSEDGAFEVAIVKPPAEPGGEWWQLESITVSWLIYNCKPFSGDTPMSRMLGYINETLAGDFDPAPGRVAWKCEPCDMESPEQHGRCHLCA